MLQYEVVSDSDRVVPGLGVFKKDEPQTFGLEANETFMRIAGIPLITDNVPEGVEVTLTATKGKEG